MKSTPNTGIKDLYLQGNITRETYWTETSKTFLALSSLGNLFSNSDTKLIFSAKNPKIIFPIESLHSTQIVTLEIDFTEVREAPFQILAEGRYEHFLSTIFFTLCSVSTCFFDIGANIGFYTIGAQKFNPEIKCYAFEPNKYVAARFRENLAMNSSSNDVKSFNYALGLQNELGSLKVPTANGSAGATLTDSYQGEYARVVEVEIHSLDEFMFLGSCDLLKIDVEGYELNVITGGLGFIKRNLPIIFIELMRKWMKSLGHHPNQVLDKLFSLGYECYAIGNSALIPITHIHDDTLEQNFLFVHSEDSRKKYFAHLITQSGGIQTDES